MKDMLPCRIGLDDLSNCTIGRGTGANLESQLLGVGSDSSISYLPVGWVGFASSDRHGNCGCSTSSHAELGVGTALLFNYRFHGTTQE